MTFRIEASERLKKLPPYLFAEIDRKKQEVIAQGKDVIDLGIGDPDIPTAGFIIDELYRGAKDPENHRYPSGPGLKSFREEAARWFERRFHVKLDPATEVHSLIGSKEGIAHMPLAVLNPGDVCLVPDPGYPPYKSGTIFANAEPYLLPLKAENGFLPDYDAIPADVLKRAKLLFINYPNNPTGACCDMSFFDRTVAFAKKHNIIVCHDAAYSEMAYDGYVSPSFLQAKGAMDVGVEFHSLSKTYCMTGWRVGFVVGNKDIVKLLAGVKSHIDSGTFQAVQIAGIKALRDGDATIAQNAKVFEKRRDIMVSGLKKLGFNPPQMKATFYLFVPVPKGMTSSQFCMKMLDEAAIIVTPGNGFGPYGEGYFRIALTLGDARLKEALVRIGKVMGKK